MIPESQNYKELKAHLREMFQMDQPDLDFGIYRIMNQKREEIEKFLDKDLLPQVRIILKNNQPIDKDAIQQEITKLENNLRDAGVDPDTSPKIQALRTKLTKTFDIDKLESELYSDLYNFFKRYYSEGDFMSLRRYKQGVYALPYEGEEVKLHWANHDQYYIKTSENLKNYSFKSSDTHRVRFEITHAGTELNNNKADKDKERRFILHSENPLTENGNELIIRFEFRADNDKRKQDDINKDTFIALRDLAEIARFGLLELVPTDKNPNRTKLEKHLTDFTAKNSFDYFIHKDLGKFLRQELDFYIKNEIMHLDDIDNQTTDYIEGYLSKIRAMRSVAGKIITFLASLEDFQKKLWLKKKFVLDTHYCITLDHIIKADNADELLGVIAGNTAQINEWIKLFAIDDIKGDLGTVGFEALAVIPASGSPSFPTEVQSTRERESYEAKKDSLSFLLTQKNGNDESLQNGEAVIPCHDTVSSKTKGLDSVLQRSDESLKNAIAFLRQNDKLLIDTKFFPSHFKYRLLSLFDNLDAQTDGVLINSENFQALNLLQERYKKSIKTIFIDPPYNTEEDRVSGKFIYKDNYGHSSWVQMIFDRVQISQFLQLNNGLLFASIDDNEIFNLKLLLDNIYGSQNFKANIIWHSRKSKQNDIDISLSHNYIINYSKNKNKKELYGQPLNETEFENPDNDPKGKWKISPMDAPGVRERTSFFVITNPITKKDFLPPKGRHWTVFEEDVPSLITEGRIYFGKNGTSRPQWKRYWEEVQEDSQTIGTIWSDVDTATNATKELENILGHKQFETPKPVNLLEKISQQSTANNDTILDYFAGSGTTGHAVINLNREDLGSRKYILVEMGEYFNSVTKPRIQKAVYSRDWKDGKPVGRDGVSHIFKYMTLEQYEDSLDNLGDPETGRFGRTQGQQEALDHANRYDNQRRFYEGYMLSYMLDIESRGSQSLLNIDKIDNPFDYKLKITRNDETQIISVDLIETFNYLLGLTVGHIDYDKSGIITVKGINALGENCMIIWRNVENINNAALDTWFSKRYSAKDFEFDAIYVNGDNNIENMKLQGDMWKVRLIEAEFKRLMFSVSDI